MAEKSKKNFLDYTGMTHEELETQVNNLLNADPRFETFQESAIAQTIIEIFTGATDMTNYYLERRAEESFLDTAKLKSSIILLAKQLGYVIQRPIPATTSLNMNISGNLSELGITSGTTIPLTKFETTFTHDGLNYILPKSLEYTITQEDIDLGSSLNKDIYFAYTSDGTLIPDTLPTSAVEYITLYQGDFETFTVPGSTNSQIGQIFQKYKINDPKFSNLFGNEDITYDATDATFTKTENFTKVGISNDEDSILGSTAEEEDLFEIDRRSLINQESLGEYGDAKKLCLIRTHMDGSVELIFGDGNFASKGPTTLSDNIYVQYLSTDGKAANKIGVIGDTLNPNQVFLTGGTNPGIDISSLLTFTLKKNITGGADLEDIDSIRYNAPGIYASLDRLVTGGDYNVYLKTLTSPINVKNSIAWGEQEEARAQNIQAIFRLFNVVFYSVLGEIYEINTNPTASKIKPLAGSNSLQDGAVLEGEDYSPEDVTSSFSYFNLFIKQSLPSEIGRLDALNNSHPVIKMKNKVDAKSQVTVSNVYTTPLIQDFKVTGTVYVSKLADKLSVQTRANNSVYYNLNEAADFHVPIYKSNIIEAIEEISEVEYVDIKLTPVDEGLEGLGDLELEPAIVSYSASADIISVISTGIENYMESAGFASTTSGTGLSLDETTTTTLPVNPWSYFGKDWILESNTHQRVGKITERSFQLELVKPIYDAMNTSQSLLEYRDSSDFKEIIKKMHNSLWYTIKSSMLDSNGNIINYSMRNEIARLNLSSLSYVFKK